MGGTSSSAARSVPDVAGHTAGTRKAILAADPGVVDALLQQFAIVGNPAEGRFRVLIEEVLHRDMVPRKYRRDLINLIADSLTGVRLAATSRSEFAADIGSGYGFPGLVLAAAMTETQFTLLEVDPVRSEFLESTSTKMGLTNVSVLNWPVEEWRDGLGRCDFVTSRNVALLPTVVEWAAPLLRLEGSAFVWSHTRDEIEEKNAGAAAEATGMQPGEILSPTNAQLGGNKELSYVHIYTKQAETPPEFPRARKAALKNPIMAETTGDTRWDMAARKRTQRGELKREKASKRAETRRANKRRAENSPGWG